MENQELETLKRDIDEILQIAGDDEAAHSYEDDLHLELLKKWLPPAMWAELERLNNADFERWCA